MIVALETRLSCPNCDHKIKYTTVATVRVNRRSLRFTGNGLMIGLLESHLCPGCGQEIPRDKPLDREPYVPVPEDAVKVAEYRKRKWGIEDSGEPVEKVPG